MSAYFWTFSDPPTISGSHDFSINTVLNVSQKGHCLTPPIQFFCWRNIGMTPCSMHGRAASRTGFLIILQVLEMHFWKVILECKSLLLFAFCIHHQPHTLHHTTFTLTKEMIGTGNILDRLFRRVFFKMSHELLINTVESQAGARFC